MMSRKRDIVYKNVESNVFTDKTYICKPHRIATTTPHLCIPSNIHLYLAYVLSTFLALHVIETTPVLV